MQIGFLLKPALEREDECDFATSGGRRVSESEAWRVAGGCRNARFMVWRKGAGMRGLECEKNSGNKEPSVRLLVPCLPPMGLFLISQSTALGGTLQTQKI